MEFTVMGVIILQLSAMGAIIFITVLLYKHQ